MKIKTADLTGPTLDWAVAKCLQPGYEEWRLIRWIEQEFAPTANWAQGGPIKEKKKIVSGPSIDGRFFAFIDTFPKQENTPSSFGDTELIAAMRCVVVSHYGKEVRAPNRLI